MFVTLNVTDDRIGSAPNLSEWMIGFYKFERFD